MVAIPLLLVSSCQGGPGRPAAGQRAAGATGAGAAAAGSATGPAAPTAGPAAGTPAAGGPVTPSAVEPSCPTSYAAPDPDRPVVTLDFDVAADGSRVTGREQVAFTPDQPIDEVVFRLWPNAPRTAAAGADLRVTAVRLDGAAPGTVESAGAPAGHTGTLLRIPLRATVAAGTTLHADLDFTLVLPVGANDRVGSSPATGTVWFASSFPLLAYQRDRPAGAGYASEPATGAFAETTTSEDFRLADLAVTTGGQTAVLATGVPGASEPTADGRLRRHFSADAVRDVSVAAGRFRLATTAAAGTPVEVGVAPGLPDDPATVAAVIAAAVSVFIPRFGPFPYPRLTVAVVPDVSGGIEYPGAILLGTKQNDATPFHEVAHEWFYGLVGDNQARDPWLDESFATYAEAVARGREPVYEATVIPASGQGRVGAPMTYWGSRSMDYYRSVYVQGAVALVRGRRAEGPAAFDRALRCYVAANAHRIAEPIDVEQAFARLPAALAALRAAGALAG